MHHEVWDPRGLEGLGHMPPPCGGSCNTMHTLVLEGKARRMLDRRSQGATVNEEVNTSQCDNFTKVDRWHEAEVRGERAWSRSRRRWAGRS